MSKTPFNTLQENTLAISALANIMGSSLGPHAYSKLIVDPKGKILVSQDGAFILRQLQVTQPAARLVVDSVLTLDEMLGDGTTSAAILTAALVQKAYECVAKGGVTVFNVVQAYRLSLQFIIQCVIDDLIIESLEGSELKQQVDMIVGSCLSSKLTLHMDAKILAELLSDAIAYVSQPLIPYRIHLQPMLGRSIQDSMLLKNSVLLPYKSITKIKELPESGFYPVAFINGSLQRQRSRIKHTALLSTTKELYDWQIDEEAEFEKQAKHIIETGALVVIVTGHIHRLVAHHLQKNNILAIALEDESNQPDTFYNFICETLNCKMMYRYEDLTSDSIGSVRSVKKISFSSCGNNSTSFLCFDNSNNSNISIRTCTLVIRSGTRTQCDELIRHCHDAIQSIKSVRRKFNNKTEKQGMLPGAGAFEIECAVKLRKWINNKYQPDSKLALRKPSVQEIIGIECFADALEAIPRILSNNYALDVTETMNTLLQMHCEGNASAGVPSLYEGMHIENKKPVLDNSFTKRAILRISTDTACTILQISSTLEAKSSLGKDIVSA